MAALGTVILLTPGPLLLITGYTPVGVGGGSTPAPTTGQLWPPPRS